MVVLLKELCVFYFYKRTTKIMQLPLHLCETETSW